MKCLHVFPVDKFTNPYIEFINKHFNEHEHLFLLYGILPNERIMLHSNVCYCESFKRMVITFVKLLYKAEKIYFHSLFCPPKIFPFLFVQPWLLQKCNWIIWGGDLYSYRQQAKCDIKSKFADFIKRVVVSNFNSIITLVEEDYEFAKEWYHVKGTYYKGFYVTPVTLEFLRQAATYKRKDNICRIQIGNSATPENCHFEAIDMLGNFKEENIKIYCPLSYGDGKYAESVVDYGYKCFGDKFIPMLDFLTPESYCEFLGKIDIGIFNNNRQQGLGNISALSFLGKKIYLREGTSMWKELVDNEGMAIYKTSAISNLNFAEFCSISAEEIQKNSNQGKLWYDELYVKKIWSKIFNA